MNTAIMDYESKQFQVRDACLQLVSDRLQQLDILQGGLLIHKYHEIVPLIPNLLLKTFFLFLKFRAAINHKVEKDVFFSGVLAMERPLLLDLPAGNLDFVSL